MFTLLLGILCAVCSFSIPICASLAPQIPSIASFTPTSGSETFVLSSNTRIVVDSKYGGKGSPSAYDFAKTFQQDLVSITKFNDFPKVKLSHYDSETKSEPNIYVVIDPALEYKLFNSKTTDEGYDLVISSHTIQINARAPIGTWRAMTTLAQQAVLAVAAGKETIAFPVGQASDTPGWEVRGFMLDAGRHWFNTKFLST
jgi:hexosaminidase